MHDPTDPQAAERANAEQAKRDRQKREQRRVVLRKVLSSENGRTFVSSLIDDEEHGGVFRLPFDIDQSERTHLTAFRNGVKYMAARLTEEIVNSCPELWTTMLRERADRMRLASDT